MTDRLRLTWPDPAPFRLRNGRALRLLAISDEVDPALESARTREALGPIDLVLGCGDLEPTYLSFVADAFRVPMRYVRGNHDVGAAWSETRRAMTPEPLEDGHVVNEDGLAIVGFSGSPVYSADGMERGQEQVSGSGMWWRVLTAWPRIARRAPALVLSHAAPRGLNDAPDIAHRGFAAFRWLADRVHPPLWLHGHTALVRRGVDGRTVRHGDTLLVNVTGATVVELLPPDDA